MNVPERHEARDQANWFIVIDLSTNHPAYGGEDGDLAQSIFSALPRALFGGQDRSGIAIRTLWTRQKGPDAAQAKEALRGH